MVYKSAFRVREAVKPTPTRTLNPLPFGDLEPHRFEDLVRQLAYDLRRWKALEATGRSGSDRGADIRAVELVPIDDPQEEDDGEESAQSFAERSWIFQCKREKSLPPKAVRNAVEESIPAGAAVPHGFVLAAACDVSTAARDAFREEMVARGVQEFFIWAKSELEDLLFQPKNDRLLFAYFGIALQPRRRGLVTSLRSEIAKKKQLQALIAEEEGRGGKLVLLRDPTDERYPHTPGKGEPPGRWLLCRALSLKRPGNLIVMRHEYLAATTPDGRKWDAILDFDVMLHGAEGELRAANAWGRDDQDAPDRSAFEFWHEYIEESQRAYLKEARMVPLERILALDVMGDGFFPVPQILVEFASETGPFSHGTYPRLERANRYAGAIDLDVDASNRTRIFPVPLPDRDGPEPAGFDDTEKGAQLTGTMEAKLKDFLSTVAPGPTSEEDASNAARKKRIEKLNETFAEFRNWREKVAVPVFSAFVMKLRKEGHRGRVVVCSLPVNVDGRGPEGHESVELKVRIFRQKHYDSPGTLSVRCAEFPGAWQTTVSPSPRESRSSYPAQGETIRVDKNTSKEQLETAVLEMLQRLSRD